MFPEPGDAVGYCGAEFQCQPLKDSIHAIQEAFVRGGSRNFREVFLPQPASASNFTAIFDGKSKFLPSIDLEKFYGQLIKNFEMEGFLGAPETPLKLPLIVKHIPQ